MSSPSEPGYPRAGDRAGSSNGSAAGGEGGAAASKGSGVPTRPSGQITETGEAPPWQRGTVRAPQTAAPEPREMRDEGPRPSGAHSAGVEARLQRFVSGTEAPEAEQPRQARNAATRTEVVRPEAYASELPDLSSPSPRSPQRKAAADTPAQRTGSAGAGPTARIQVANRAQQHGPLRASMQIRRVDPWTVLKVSLVLSVVLFFVWMIAVAFLYLVLGGMGVWSKLNSNVGDLLTSASGASGGELVSSGTIFGGAALVGLVNIVVLCAMATIGAFIYNLTTDLVGGVEVTLADRD
ncbi:hypothetical protein M2272_002290 [Mycobacterium frederiksbergense]|uniref:DUF3566 domain-containing protein n=1 Tax=Mycolicibacterium frederiksbergense TaxID=117567 RepID=A0ABT6L0U1_9MYCO|nr:DUF3566 domain-containing protein [Mycolicibacterium frederiksbergense]MDH6195650.1 hypothetical protein [Mycolicibacterium frederiksbergense]